MIQQNLIKQYEDSFKEHWDLPALSNYKEDAISYGEMSSMIAKTHILFKELGVKRGDKVALFGKNSANWCVAFMSTISYGAIVVPILADFKPDDATNIIDHSDSVLLFTDKQMFTGLDEKKISHIHCSVCIDEFSLLTTKPEKRVKEAFDRLEPLYSEKYPKGFTKDDLEFAEVDNKEILEINYTSGTTGFSKGVVLSANSLAANVKYGQENMELHSGDKMLTVLPLAHCYACAFDFLFPMSLGVHITILRKLPATPLLLKAFGEIQPHLILFIPLFFEKLYKKMLLPTIQKPIVKVLLAIPGINNILYGVFRKKLVKAFGGRFREAVLGGAPISAEVEKFFKKMKFPFAIGYGMTECGPLIAYDGWKTRTPMCAGKILEGYLELKIDSQEPYKEVGEILVKGENVMNGYYKNEEATKEAIDEEGWLHTGDLGITDPEGYIYIKGRSKSMLLGPSGQNIYPEEIEAKLNNLPYINETVVLMNEDHKLEALVHPDEEALKADEVEDKLTELMEENRKLINESLKAYEGIVKMHIHEEEFVKTPKRSIKRFLYSLEGKV